MPTTPHVEFDEVGPAPASRVDEVEAGAVGPSLRFRDLYEGAMGSVAADRLTLPQWMEAAERWRILRALRESEGNRSETARRLGIGRRTLYAKMERLGIHRSGGPSRSAEWCPGDPDNLA